MKHFISIWCVGVLCSVQLCAANYTAFFKQALQGGTPSVIPSTVIVENKIETWQKKVWNDWKKANKELEEEKLPSVSLLSGKKTGRWHIPAALEPNAVMPFYWGVKDTSVKPGPYPLFVYLHGSGPKDREWQNGIRLCSNFKDAPSLYFIPQIPNEGSYYRWWQKSKQYVWDKLLRQTLASDKVDPDRIYFFGISEGGYGSQRLASFYADYLAGAGPMAGGEPLKNAPAENYANISFSFLTGDKDDGFFRHILTKYTKEALDSLQNSAPDCYNHRVLLIPGAGHHIDYSYTTPWLRQYTRNPYPRYVCWEDFEMDGQHRKGFYNLEVVERPRADKRTRYDMTIKGNKINITVRNVDYKTTEKDPGSGIELKFSKSYTTATSGKFIVYLCDELVDLNQNIDLTVNGQLKFSGRVRPDLKYMLRSCLTYYDPRRIYPAAIEVSL